jgi:16S rRNA (guanine527-N7)-methyltransferase
VKQADRLRELALQLFAIDLNASELRRFDRYLDLLRIWSKRVNLVSARSSDEIVERHLLDSMAPLHFVNEVKFVADFGSGAGFPGIPLAILSPATRFFLVEARRKRATFLRHAARELDLRNIRIHEGRGEEWNPREPIDLTIGRAIRPEILGYLSLRVLRVNGSLIAMRKRDDSDLRIDGFAEVQRSAYVLPQGEQHEIVVMHRK